MSASDFFVSYIVFNGIPYKSQAFYLELGVLNIETIVKARRPNYLHYLVTLNPEEMLSKIFMRQWKYPVAGDWALQAKQNLADFSIPDDLKWIKAELIFLSKH